MVIYADTSFLVPLYVRKQFSVKAQRQVAALAAALIFTPFHRLELRAALRVRVYRNLMDEKELRHVLMLVDEDLKDDVLSYVPLDWNGALREAEEIGAVHHTRVGARSFDLLHVSSAIVLRSEEFLTCDQRQGELARRAGLKVKILR